jgi:hypothetical protein
MSYERVSNGEVVLHFFFARDNITKFRNPFIYICDYSSLFKSNSKKV